MSDSHLTQLIQRAQEGDVAARDDLYALIYKQLHQEAARLVREKGPAADASSLVNEGFMRLFRTDHPLDIPSRRYFFFAASRKMRDILVERTRKNSRRTPTTQLDQLADLFLEDFRRQTQWEFLAVHEILERFAQSTNPRQRRRHELIELTYFAGLSVKEAARVLEVSYSQARDDQRLALAELAVELERREP